MNIVARAIASSTSAGAALRRRSCWLARSSFSASTHTRAIAATVSTGILPGRGLRRRASRRRCRRARRSRRRRLPRASGSGLLIIDSIICVAVMTSRFFSRASRIMRFCSAGTTASPTSTARSPRATMIASDGVEDLVERGDRFGALDLRDHERVAAGLVHEIARPADVVARARKGHAEEIGLELRGGLDVLHVLLGQRRRREAAAPAVDALVVARARRPARRRC